MSKILLILLSSVLSYTVSMAHGVMENMLMADDTLSDSVRQINEVFVKGQLRHHETIAPQKLSGTLLNRVSAHSVADALRLMSGVQIKDYGGMGGLKTINLRSMGSQHVGIFYDGVELGNAQNGQIDLGQFSLDNIEEISIYNGQRSALLQTASDLANAGTLYIRTKAPSLNSSRPMRTTFKMQTGASHLLRGSMMHEHRLNDRWLLSTNVEGLASSGKYDFTFRRLNYDGTVAYDTTATRKNGDIQSLRGEINLWYRSDENETAQIKAYTYLSTRGIPGAIVNNVWRRGERQGDRNTFIQGLWQKDITARYTIRTMAKYADYATHYINKDVSTMQIDQRYNQQEVYASMSHLYAISQRWNLSASYDVRYNTLWSDKPLFDTHTRWTHHLGLSTAVDFEKLQMMGSIVYTAAENKQLSPAFFIAYTPTNNKDIQLHAFVKQSYRLPTFNELYYTEIGNANLLPEKAIQHSIGMKYKFLSLDLYHNTVHDKIVAYPKGQQFRWTMLNLGEVEILGLDIQLQKHWSLTPKFQLFSLLTYTYQQAKDITNHNDSYYNHQIPYTPRHSGSFTASADWHNWALTYNFVYTGERYCQQENIAYNHLQPWYTSDVSVVKSFTLRNTKLQATLQINNLFNQQYDVIINYPMPGRQIFGTIKCEF